MRTRRLTLEEKQGRRDTSFCLYCGGAGHSACECKVKKNLNTTSDVIWGSSRHLAGPNKSRYKDKFSWKPHDKNDRQGYSKESRRKSLSRNDRLDNSRRNSARTYIYIRHRYRRRIRNPWNMTLTDFKAKLSNIYIRFQELMSDDVSRIHYALKSMDGPALT
ncbi:hypothetical protein BGX34_001598 [Mortierella sp. NVP85]|nr:hypothetical protein BGX34_001598 [Mortierella sp. NVP85]